jgi:hypothetical protein
MAQVRPLHLDYREFSGDLHGAATETPTDVA